MLAFVWQPPRSLLSFVTAIQDEVVATCLLDVAVQLHCFFVHLLDPVCTRTTSIVACRVSQNSLILVVWLDLGVHINAGQH